MRKDSILLNYYYSKLPKKALGGGPDASLRKGNSKGALNGFQLDNYETAGQVNVTNQTTKSPKSGKCKDGYGCKGNSSSMTGFGMDMGLGDPQKSGTGFDNWKSFNTPVGWNDLLTYNSISLEGKDLKQYNKDITARTKSLQGQFPGLTEEQLRVAGGDSSRIRQRMQDLPRYDQSSEQTFDKAYHQFYRPLMNQKTPVTVEQILNFQAQQPGGLGAFKTTVSGNYGRKKAQYGGGLLSRTVTCSNCGHSWKGVDGGEDVMTCHNCGGMIKMQNGGIAQYGEGGDISIPELEQGGWLDNYANGGGFLMPFAQGGMVDPILKYPDGGPYTVKSGDTLWRIARQYGMTPQQIAEANSIQNINDIKVNQLLNIPTLNAPVEPATPAVQQVVDADFVGPQVTTPQPRESVIQSPTNVRRVQAPVTQERVVNTRHETPQVLSVQKPTAQSQAPVSAVVGEAPPLFKTAEERESWRQRLKEVAKNALSGYNNDDEYLAPLKGIINSKTGKEMTWADDENCINGICGLNKTAGMEYNAGTYQGRYIGNQTFYDNVNNHKEDYYRVNGNFQPGDHIQLTTNGANPTHSMEIYDTYIDDDSTKMYRVIHNGGKTQFKENLYSELDLKEKIGRGDYIINRPGYSLDKEALKKEREAATSPEAKAALEKKKELIDYQTGHDPNYQYAIREDSPMFKDQPEGMKQFIKYANNVDNINDLVKKLGVDKDVIHDELLNTFGELGAENKWKNPWVGGDITPSLVGKKLAKFLPSIPLESTIERVGSLFNLGKGQSVGPGQIKMEMLDDEEIRAKEKGVKSLKELFGIKKMSDLQNYEKVIPLMTAFNIRNRQWMERKGTDFSNYLIAQPGAGLHDLKYGPGRWTPYMYRGSLRVPTTNDETKTLAHGSYADEVFHNIDENLQRTLPYKLDDGQYRGMQPVIIQAKTKKKKALGGQNNNWLNQYL